MSGNKFKKVGISDKKARDNWALTELTGGLGN